MKSVFSKLALTFLTLFLLAQCQKDRDAYYAAPDWLGKPIYETLKDEGRFGLYLELADKTNYSASLKGNGFWTVFAPNDDAIREWLAEKGYSSVADVPVSEADRVVAYSLLFNQYRYDQLSHVLNNNWDSLQSVKKRTLYYETIKKELYKEDSIWVISPITARGYNLSTDNNDNNYKFIPFYLDAQFRSRGLGATDYRLFYPNSEYTGRNIQRASVLQENIFTSNGVIHEVDKVNEPLKNFEEILQEPAYSRFWGLIQMKDDENEPLFYEYGSNLSVTQYYQKMYPSTNIDRINVKFYSTALPLNVERYTPFRTTSGEHPEKGGYTLFAPNNNGVMKFFDDRLSEYFGSIDDIPWDVWRYFINAQMCDGLIYPGQYHRLENYYNEFINGEGQHGPRWADVRSSYTDIRPASNGFFYGGNSYIKSNYFETVLTEVRFNRNYYLMWTAFQHFFSFNLMPEMFKSPLNGNPNEDYVVLLIPDALFEHEHGHPEGVGFTFGWCGENTNEMRFQFCHTWGDGFARERMQRLVRSHIFRRTKITSLNENPNIDHFMWGDQAYGGMGYALNEYGDMVRYSGGRLQMIGNWDLPTANDNDRWVTVTPLKDKNFANGTVYTIDRLLQYGRCISYPELADNEYRCWGHPMTYYLDRAKASNPQISRSVDLLRRLIDLELISFHRENLVSYTFLLPNNDAIAKALQDEVFSLAEDGTIPEDLDFGMGRDERVLQFFRYHIIFGSVFIDDGIPNELQMSDGEMKREHRAPTLHQMNLVSTFVTIRKNGPRLFFANNTKAPENRTSANIVPGANNSNLFSPRSVIHTIDHYLRPPFEPIEL